MPGLSEIAVPTIAVVAAALGVEAQGSLTPKHWVQSLFELHSPLQHWEFSVHVWKSFRHVSQKPLLHASLQHSAFGPQISPSGRHV
jgi:hypothetical protein